MIMKKVFLALTIAAMTTITAFAQINNSPDWTSPTGSWQGVVTSVGGGPPPFRVLMNLETWFLDYKIPLPGINQP